MEMNLAAVEEAIHLEEAINHSPAVASCAFTPSASSGSGISSGRSEAKVGSPFANPEPTRAIPEGLVHEEPVDDDSAAHDPSPPVLATNDVAQGESPHGDSVNDTYDDHASEQGCRTCEDATTIADKVAAFPYWYHRIPLPDGSVTPGWAPLDTAAYRIPERLDGKRVLDVGAWDGYWTFEALRRGASQVVAIDDFSDFLGSLDQKDRRAWETFDLCRDAWGYGPDRCQRRELSVYAITPELLGEFDVVFAFGLLYHLRHPLYALDLISKVCKQELYVESAILDDYSPYRGGLQKGYAGGQMVMEFYPDAQYGNNTTNWWAPTVHCLAHMVRAAGFQDVQGWKLRGQPAQLPECRGFVRGRKVTSQPATD